MSQCLARRSHMGACDARMVTNGPRPSEDGQDPEAGSAAAQVGPLGEHVVADDQRLGPSLRHRLHSNHFPRLPRSSLSETDFGKRTSVVEQASNAAGTRGGVVHGQRGGPELLDMEPRTPPGIARPRGHRPGTSRRAGSATQRSIVASHVRCAGYGPVPASSYICGDAASGARRGVANRLRGVWVPCSAWRLLNALGRRARASMTPMQT